MIGTTLGHYQIESLLGAGGMGEVYRALDVKLGRSVAVKVLPAALMADPERVARFEREAKVLAALNHPNIAGLHGLEEVDGRHLLLMELVEGDTLAQKIGRGPLRPEDALFLARQIAEALEAAHEKGIVHRDLKPANVKITPEGTVKVLDFGLAKPMRATPDSNLTNSPTLSMMATEVGMILGTAAYMSPEQAKGLPADSRSDVFSFGAVFYEMLTGRQAFRGDTAADILASVLAREPDLGALPQDLHPRVTNLVRRCLEKSPRQRWQAVGDLRVEIETVARSPRTVGVPASSGATRQPMWKRAWPVAGAAIAAGILSGVAVSQLRPLVPPSGVTRFAFAFPNVGQLATTRQSLAMAPDGTAFVYAANNQLYLRSMSEFTARAIAGTDLGALALCPTFSPDGRAVAFWSGRDGTLKRVPVSGGTAVTIAAAEAAPLGLTWGADGLTFVAPNKGIMRVAAEGGTPDLLISTTLADYYGPQILPGGKTVLVSVASGTGAARWDKGQVVVQSLESGERKVLIEGGSDARYLPSGHVVYAVGGTLFAVPFDPARLEVSGVGVPVLAGVRRSLAILSAAAYYSVSASGSIVYLPGPSGVSAGVDLALTDRAGRVTRLPLPSDAYRVPAGFAGRRPARDRHRRR